MVKQLRIHVGALGDGKAEDEQIFLNETDTISGELEASLFVGIFDLTVAETGCSRPSLPFPLPFPLPFVGCSSEA